MTDEEIQQIVDKIETHYGPKPPATEGKPAEMLVQVPFCGLYNSVITAMCDNEQERLEDDVRDSLRMGILVKAEIDAGKAYVGTFELDMDDVYDSWLKAVETLMKNYTGIALDLRYADCRSPREYNFYSDQLEAWVSKEDMRKLITYVQNDPECKKRLDELVTEATTSRDGYMPFYDAEDFDFSRDDLKPFMYELVFQAIFEEGDWEIVDKFMDTCDFQFYEEGFLAKHYAKQQEKKGTQQAEG